MEKAVYGLLVVLAWACGGLLAYIGVMAFLLYSFHLFVELITPSDFVAEDPSDPVSLVLLFWLLSVGVLGLAWSLFRYSKRLIRRLLRVEAG